MLLNSFRSGASSILAKLLYSILLVMAVVGLGMMDYNGMFRSGGAHGDTVATVAGDPLSIQEFDSFVRRVLSTEGHGMDPKLAYQMGYINQILMGQISERLISRSAYDLGIQVSDDLIAKEVSKQLDETLAKHKDMTKQQAFKTMLMNSGRSEGQFAQEMKTGLADNVLRGALQQDAKNLPEDEARDLYRFVHEERTVKFIALQNDAIRDYKEPSDAALTPFYETNKERYAIPETRSFSMIVLTPDSIKGIEISDDEIKKAYEGSKASYGVPEKRVVQQAIFKDKAAADDAIAKAKKGGAAAWSAEQTVTKDALSAELAEAAFNAGKGDIVGPVQDARGLGWRALVVKDIIPGKDRPLAEAKDQIRKDLLNSRRSEELYKLSGKLDDQLAGGTSLEDAAKDMGLSIKKFGPVSADGGASGGSAIANDYPKDEAAILKTVFEQSEGEISSVQELKDDTFAAYRVDHVTPKSYKPLAAVKDELKKMWIADQQDTLNRNRALAALQALDSGKKTLEQVAQDDHAQLQTLTLKRGDQAAAPLTPAAKDKLFSIDKGKNALSPAKGGYIVGQVTAIKLPDADKIPAAELSDLSDSVANSEKDKYLEAYAGYLRGKYGYRINDEVLKRAYGTTDSGNGQN